MTLGQLQREFPPLVALLIQKIHSMGYQCTLGDAFRDPRVHGELGEKKGYGHPRSAHKNKLAIDINLFLNGKYLPSTEDHKELGEWWEKQHPLARWGGRFNDGNHYSLEWEGVQ